MDFFRVVLVLQELLWIMWVDEPLAPARALIAAPQYIAQRISASSSNTAFVPSTVPAGPVLTSTVPIIGDSCPVSDFTSILWFCPSATATATATTAATTTSTSTPVFSPSDIPEPVTVEARAPSVTGILCIGLVAFFAALLICSKRRMVRLKGMQLPVTPPEEVANLTCWESIVTGAPCDWSAERETLSNIAILQLHDNERLRSQITANKHSSDAREDAHQKEIDKIKSERNDELRRLHEEITARELAHSEKIDSINADRAAVEKDLREQIATKESTHRVNITTRERSYQAEISKIKDKHNKEITAVQKDANNQRRRLRDEARKRWEAEAKLDAFIKDDIPASGLPKPTAQTSPQDGAPTSTGDQLLTPYAVAVSSITQNAAPDSTTDQLLPAPTATEDSTKEAKEALSVEPASPATNSEPDSAEPTEETSPQDITPGTEGQLPVPPAATSSPIAEPKEPLPAESASPTTTTELDSAAKTSPQDVEPQTEDQLPSTPAATESSITEPEEAFLASIPSPIIEAEDELPAETEGLSEAESTNSTEHEQEQVKEQKEDEKVEKEPQNSGMPLSQPASTGEGAEQIPQDQEKGLAQDAPVPTEEPAAISQLTEPEAALGPATSDDGASEAPVTKEVLLEEQTGDRETKEPTAVEESDEVLGATPSDDGASMTAVTRENGNGLEMTTAVESDQAPPEGMDLVEEEGSPTVAEAGASESLTSLLPPNAAVVDLDDKMSDASPDESPNEMVLDDGEGAVNDSGDEQHNSAGETAMDTSEGVDSGNDTPNEPQAMHASPANEAQQDFEMRDDDHAASASEFGSQFNNAATEIVQPTWYANAPPLQLVRQLPGIRNLSGPSGPIQWDFSRDPTFQRPFRTQSRQPPRPLFGNLTLPLPFLSPPVQSLQPANNGSDAPSGAIQWNISGPATFQRPLATLQPRTQTNVPLASPAQGNIMDKARAMRNWANEAIDQATHWSLSPEEVEEGGTDAASLAKMKADCGSELSRIINQAQDAAKYLEGDFQAEKSTMTMSAEKMFTLVLRAVESMRQGYEGLGTSKGCPYLFMDLLRDIDRMLKELRGLKSQPTTQPAQPQLPAQRAQSTQQTSSQPTPQPATRQPPRFGQNTNPLLRNPRIHGNPFEIANTLNRWANEANKKAILWKKSPERGGPDATFFAQPYNNNCPFWATRIDMWYAADYLDYEFQKPSITRQADAVFDQMARPAFVAMRAHYQELGALKNCPDAFEGLLGCVGRVLTQLNRLREEFLTTLAQSQPSTQRQRSAQSQLSTQSQPFAQSQLSTQSQPFARSQLSTQSRPFAQSQPSAQSQLSTQSQPFAQNQLSAQSQPFAQSQPPAQSTQQVPPPQPVSQAANPLLVETVVTKAANLIKAWLNNAEKMHGEWVSNHYDAGYFIAERTNPDSAFSMVVKQMAWAAHYLEGGYRTPAPKPNGILRGCVQLAGSAYYHYKKLYNSKGQNNLLFTLMRDIDRVLEALREVKP